MNIPFTTEQFLQVFRNYNNSVFPFQIFFYVLAVIIIYFSSKDTEKSGKIISFILSFLWLWMGIVYHIIFFTAINKAAYFFGIIFIMQAVLFLIFGVFRDKFSFRFSKDIYGITGLMLILYALIIYPLLGYLFNHIYPSSPTFGLPCPTTIFTFGLLLWNREKPVFLILMIPFIWSIIGFTVVFNFGIFEDTGLLVSGLAAFSLLFFRTRTISNAQDKNYILN